MHSKIGGQPLLFRKILLATDFSPPSSAAFRVAVALSRRLKAKLVILHIFECPEAALPGTGGLALDLDQFREKAKKSLNELLRGTLEAGVMCEADIAGGIASDTILDTISRTNIDLAVLGTRAIHGVERFIFGSTAETILRQAPCPVLTVGPQAGKEVLKDEGPVIFATDFHSTTANAISYAASLSESIDSQLHCLHVLPRSLENESNNEIIPHILTEALQHIAKENVATRKAPICSVIYGSEVSNAIVEYARQNRAKLVVLGVRRTSLVAAHVSPHIAYRIITESPCPVMTMAFGLE